MNEPKTHDQLLAEINASLVAISTAIGDIRSGDRATARDIKVITGRLDVIESRLAEGDRAFVNQAERTATVLDAADKAFLEASRVNSQLGKLYCMEEDTNPDCPHPSGRPVRILPRRKQNILDNNWALFSMTWMAAAVVTAIIMLVERLF